MASYHHLPKRDCWIARVYDPSRPGKERTRTFGKGLSKQAAAKVAPGVIDALLGEANEAAERRGTFGEYAEKWLQRRRTELSPTTIAGGYDVIVKRIIKRFGRKPIDAVTRTEIRDWYDELRAQKDPKLSDSTIERHHQVLRAILYQAVDDEVLLRNPAAKLKRPRTQREELTIPTVAAVTNAWVGLGGDFGRFFRLLVVTGMRRGEMCGLAWGDIEDGQPLSHEDGTVEPTKVIHVRRSLREAGGSVTLGPTKSKQTRQLRVGADAIVVLEDQLRSVMEQLKGAAPLPSDPVFPWIDARDRTGHRPHRPGWASEWWRRQRADYGMDGIRLHSLRHYHATSLLDDGVPLNTVSERLGHSLASTTSNIYGHRTTVGDELAVRSSARLRSLPSG